MTATRFLDTNVLLYSISGAPEEARKRQVAIELLDRDDCALSIQVLQEFYAQATRESRGDRITHELAVGLIETWMRFAVQDNDVAVMRHALAIRAAHRLSFWDSAIVAAAVAQGCSEILTEDMAHGRQLEGVRIVNPFL
ncbi:MAG: PIN domain-containing protein [Pseudomonadota bacterium]|nr:PIN domain-containing protein [Pseudomonadota bacterium]